MHDERIEAILADNTPVETLAGPKLAVLIVPVSATFSRTSLDLSGLPNPIENSLSHNGEGLIEYNNGHYYHQVFRDGRIEYVESYFPDAANRKIPIAELELGARHFFLPKAFRWLQALGVSPPCFVFLSLLNIRGFTLALNYDQERRARILTRYLPRTERNRPFRNDHLHVESTVSNTLEPDMDSLIRPAHDWVWQEFQYPRSINYNDKGVWCGPKQ